MLSWLRSTVAHRWSRKLPIVYTQSDLICITIAQPHPYLPAWWYMSTPPLAYTCYTIAGYFLRNQCVWPLNVELAIHHTHGSVSTDPTIWESVALAPRPLPGKVVGTSLNPRCVDHRVKGWHDTLLWRPLATRRQNHREMCLEYIIIQRLVYTFPLPRNRCISFKCCNWG
jgi:hypothetical protein